MSGGFEDLGFARVDTDRARRCGRPETIFCQGKTPGEVAGIAAAIYAEHGIFLGTRASPEQAEAALLAVPSAEYHARARVLVAGAIPPIQAPPVAVVCAGTSDLPVAEEAALTLTTFGRRVEWVRDAGVAGIHRLMPEVDRIRVSGVAIVVAGMEGALPSLVAGLVDIPIIAVPTSVGYGASFGGLAALLGMLNSCGSGVTVVNIDNGFGAAFAADAILRLTERGH